MDFLFAATPLIKEIAKKLLTSYKSPEAGLDPELLPQTGVLSAALLRLVNKGLLDLEGKQKVDYKPNMLETVKAAVEWFQKSGGLWPDGILGARTINALNDPGCLNHLTRIPSETNVPKREAGDYEKTIRYWICQDASGKDLLPPLNGPRTAREMLRQAWLAWAVHIDINVMSAKSAKGANVLITSKPLDGPGNDLADAQVGPPGARQLELRFDSTESWSTSKFLYTAIHEIGHVLGLRHTKTAGQIMGEYRANGITEPQWEDVVLAQGRFGARRIDVLPTIEDPTLP